MKTVISSNILLILLFVLASALQTFAQKKANILFIMCDDLISLNGPYRDTMKSRIPNLDSLRERSVEFTNANSVNPICAPSRASTFTGIYPSHSKCFWFDPWYKNDMLKNCKSMFQYLKDNGYKVYGAGKLHHHNRKEEFDEFAHEYNSGPFPYNGKKSVFHPDNPKLYGEITGASDGTFIPLENIPSVNGYIGWYDIKEKKPFKMESDGTRDLLPDERCTQWAIGKLKELENSDDGKPFFIGVGFCRPHTPLVVPKKYFDMFPLDTITLPPNIRGGSYYKYDRNYFGSKGFEMFDAFKESYKDDPERGMKIYAQAYLACIAFIDEQVGQLIKALDKSKYAKNTIVIFTSDHGYDFWLRDYFFKSTLWDTSTNVPFYIYCPQSEFKRSISVGAAVSHIDLYPTVKELCNLTAETKKNENGAELDGRSLVPYLKIGDSKIYDNNLALTVMQSGGTIQGTTGKDYGWKIQSYSVRNRDYRYNLYKNGTEELFNCSKDPFCFDDISDDPQYAKLKAEMKSGLKKLVPDFKTEKLKPQIAKNKKNR